MRDDSWAPYGAAAGAIAVALYVVGSLVIGTPPDFDAAGGEVAAYFDDERTRIQVGSAIHAAWTPLFVWFLATVASLARAGGPGARRAGVVAYGCGLVFIALFLVDVTSLTIGALRPENMAAAPELAAALHDVSWLAMGMAAFLVSGVLAAFAVLALRDKAIWPEWLGWLAVVAAVAYALRVGTLFTTEGAFAADGVLGLWVPVIAAAAWIVVGSVVLALNLRRVSEPGELFRST
ncbi:MAG: hypothetical protein AABM29_05280 [Actinomycetota bacterium]